ncbi:hypothetical protein NQZ68_016822 [Dissostichus eleginoides]|nr:hypothetical protein NQZ68_016822 [Dissostichus eleginoides]
MQGFLEEGEEHSLKWAFTWLNKGYKHPSAPTRTDIDLHHLRRRTYFTFHQWTKNTSECPRVAPGAPGPGPEPVRQPDEPTETLNTELSTEFRL